MLLFAGLVTGSVAVGGAGFASAFVVEGSHALGALGGCWIVAAGVLAIGLVWFLVGHRRPAPANGRFFWIGVLLGGLLAALCDGLCFSALTNI